MRTLPKYILRLRTKPGSNTSKSLAVTESEAEIMFSCQGFIFPEAELTTGPPDPLLISSIFVADKCCWHCLQLQTMIESTLIEARARILPMFSSGTNYYS